MTGTIDRRMLEITPCATETQQPLAAQKGYASTSDKFKSPGYSVFKDRKANLWAEVFFLGHREIWPFESEKFSEVLEESFRARNESLTKAQISDRKTELRSLAVRSELPVHDVSIRAVEVDGNVFIDLCDPRWNAIEVGDHGWRISKRSDIKFTRSESSLPLPEPKEGGSLDDLFRHVNVRRPADVALLTVWLLNALRGGEQPLLVLEGPEGAAKTSLAQIIMSVIDPASGLFGGLPTTETQLLAFSRKRLGLVFDNVSRISPSMSDALCRLVSNARKSILLTALERPPMRPDLADRCLFMTLDSISDPLRQTSSLIRDRFDMQRDQIFGALVDALGKSVTKLPKIAAERMPRMAEFFRFGCAVEAAGVLENGSFTSGFWQNRTEAAEMATDNDSLIAATKTLIEATGGWRGTATQLRTAIGKSENLPQSGRALSTALRSRSSLLEKLGIVVEFHRHGHDRSRMISISAADSAKPRGADDADAKNMHSKGGVA